MRKNIYPIVVDRSIEREFIDMLRLFLCAMALVLPVTAFSEIQFVRLSIDQPSYEAGTQAQVRVEVLVRPGNADYEFFHRAKHDSVVVPLTYVTLNERYAVLTALTEGEHTFEVDTYLQDKKLAASLGASIAFYAAEIARINLALSQTTNPTEIAALEVELALNQQRKTTAEGLLESARKKVDGPETIHFTVN